VSAKPIAAIVAIALVIAILTLHRLGAGDVCTGNEAVEGVFVQQMVERGNVLFPIENGNVPMFKPPLFHWTALAIDRIAGIDKVTAANLRLPSALYAIAGAILAMFFAYEILGLEAAILAGLALAAAYQYISQARFGRVDMTLCFFESLALFAFIWWMPRDRTLSGRDARFESRLAALYLMAVAMGLGVLAKGPVGAILPGASILIFMVVERRGRQILTMLDPGAIIVGVAIASSWYLACYFGGRFAFLNRQLDTENVGRFFGSLGAMAPWYYLKPILLNSAPLSIFVPIAAVFALLTPIASPSRGDADPNPASPNGGGRVTEGDAGRVARAAIRLFAIFYFATIIFFNLAAYKRRSYLLPVWPSAAIILAWWIVTIPPIRLRRVATWTFAALCAGLIVFNFIYIPRTEVRTCSDDSFRPAAEEIARVVAPADPLYLYGFHEEVAPLLFYLDRDAPILQGKLDDAPPGFIVMPAHVWKTHQKNALEFEPVLTSDHGNRRLVIIKRGKSYAAVGNRTIGLVWVLVPLPTMERVGGLGCSDRSLRPQDRLIPLTIDHVIVHHPGRLHHRITDRRSHELETARDQILAHRVRLSGARRHLPQRAPLVDSRTPADKSPDVFVEAAELFLRGNKCFRIADGGNDLQPIANDPRVHQQPRDVSIAELRHSRGLEVLECFPIGLALAQNRVPTQPGLRPFERDELEPSPIVMHRHAPLLIVVANRRLITRPGTSHIGT
jgi:4-amino-4-deoxy-L-arabinose transferase-like glycosyltransferase